MASKNNKKKENSTDETSNFFIEPEKAALLGFSIDDVMQDEDSQPPQGSLVWRTAGVVAIMVLTILTVSLMMGWLPREDESKTSSTEESAEATSEDNAVGNSSQVVETETVINTVPTLAGLDIEGEFDNLTANGNDRTALAFSLKDSAGHAYITPTQITAYLDGGGMLIAGEQQGNIVSIGDTTEGITYQAGKEPGLVVVHIKVNGIEWEYTQPIELKQMFPDSIELSLDPENLPLSADGEITKTLLIELLDGDDLVTIDYKLSLIVDQPELLDIVPDLPYITQDGKLLLEITAMNDLRTETTVNLQVGIEEIEGINNSISLTLVPVPLLIIAKQCITIVSDVRFREPLLDGDSENTLFILPTGTPVDCIDDEIRTIGANERVHISLILWVSDDLIRNNRLTITDEIEAVFDFNIPSDESIRGTLSDIDVPVTLMGPLYNGLRQVRIEGSVANGSANYDSFLEEVGNDGG